MNPLFRALLIVIGTTGAVAAAEVATRIIDGYPIAPLRLQARPARVSRGAAAGRASDSDKWTGDADALPYVPQIPLAAGVAPQWFADHQAARPDWRADPDLAARARRPRGAQSHPTSRLSLIGRTAIRSPAKRAGRFVLRWAYASGFTRVIQCYGARFEAAVFSLAPLCETKTSVK